MVQLSTPLNRAGIARKVVIYSLEGIGQQLKIISFKDFTKESKSNASLLNVDVLLMINSLGIFKVVE